MEFSLLKNVHLENILPSDGTLSYTYPFYSKNDADTILVNLIEEIEWASESLSMFGKSIPMPRLTAWYADPGVSYTYSGLKNEPLPWTRTLRDIKEKVESESHVAFNSVLLNYYRNQDDHMSWHSDNEKELGPAPVIASVSFGAERKFQVKHKTCKDTGLITIKTEHGSLILMKDEMQSFWNHRVSKTKVSMGPRVNLTFRKVF